MRTIELSLDGGRKCPISIGHDILDQIGVACTELELGKRVAIIADSAVAATHLKPVTDSLRRAGFDVIDIAFSGGDAAKSLRSAEAIYGRLIEAELDRDSWIAAVGGGVVGDLGGFVAATFLRGIDVVQVPTTIAAQVDASIGGKTGVNHELGKNTIGAFHQPQLVYIDTTTLRTLSRRECIAGMAEVVKHGLIADAQLFEFVERHVEAITSMEIGTDDLDWLIARNVEIKTSVVADDERESGRRAILNYGHTIGHAIEAAANYETYRHGEAVIFGMVAAGEIACRSGRWLEEDRERQNRLLRRLGIPPGIGDLPADRIVHYTKADKKRRDGNLRFILATGIGSVEIVDSISEDEVRSAIAHLQSTC